MLRRAHIRRGKIAREQLGQIIGHTLLKLTSQ